MKIYILKAYPTPHKWNADEAIVGYYTSKAQLLKAVKRNADIVGLEDWTREAFYREWARDRIGYAGGMLETGDIEVVTANETLNF